MADLQAIVARVRDALTARIATNHSPAPTASAPVVPQNNRAELVSRFARELEAVAGKMIGPIAPQELPDRIMAIARVRGLKSIAIGKGVASDLDAVANSLRDTGANVLDGTASIREQVAHADAGIAEADYGIAATGTLAVFSDASRPSALTLLPPASIVVLRVDRMMADLASALAAIGPEVLQAHRLTLITGPSRTADIEKRIVMGVHGPKSLDVVLVWSDDD
jgi:L-lactate dehydrogenase complex protein LldG